MTPEKAQHRLDEMVQDLGGIKHIRDEIRVPLEALASDRLEWGVTAEFSGSRRLVMATHIHGTAFDARGQWYPTKEMAEDFMASVTAPDPRLVCRRASPHWEAQ